MIVEMLGIQEKFLQRFYRKECVREIKKSHAKFLEGRKKNNMQND
jgi:hypothetical protein